jgi:hypothetical protein
MTLLHLIVASFISTAVSGVNEVNMASEELLALEVNMGDSLLRFDANLLIADYGASRWCNSVSAVADECQTALVEGVKRALVVREQRPQSLVDGAAASENRPDLFGEKDACTDNMHVMGRCMVIRTLAQYVVDGAVPGDYVEAGVHVGDSAAAVARAFTGRGSRKKLYLFDSFEGMPKAVEAVDGGYAMELSPDDAKKGWGHEASAAAVSARLAGLGTPPEQVVLREGWFNATFSSPPLPTGDVAFLMVDGDWYSSVLETLERWYDAVPPGGVVVLDDYGYWEGARRAVGDFLRRRPPGEEFPLFERYGPDILWWIKGRTHNRPQ